jgi:hypothetical protein
MLLKSLIRDRDRDMMLKHLWRSFYRRYFVIRSKLHAMISRAQNSQSTKHKQKKSIQCP